MLPDKLLEELHQLSRSEKLRAVKFLVNELAAEELDFDTPDGLAAGFRTSWGQAMREETRPVSELWAEPLVEEARKLIVGLEDKC